LDYLVVADIGPRFDVILGKPWFLMVNRALRINYETHRT
jgi:hypothetical protein